MKTPSPAKTRKPKAAAPAAPTLAPAADEPLTFDEDGLKRKHRVAKAAAPVALPPLDAPPDAVPPATDPPPAAKQPTPPDAKDIIARVNDISGYAKGTWFALLGVLVFSGITLLGVEDADFFAAESKTDLPLVNVSVPVTYFFGAGAALVAAAYIYFHLYLELLWAVIGKAPAQIGGEPLSERISPWLIGEWALRRRDWLARRVARRQGRGEPPASASRRALAWIGSVMSLFFVWLFGPLVLFYFWWRSMPAHIGWMTVLLGLLFAFALWTGWRSWQAAARLLAGQPSYAPLVGRSRLWRARLLSAAGFAAFALVLTFISLVRTGSEWLPGEHPLARDYDEGKKAEWVKLFKEEPAEYWRRRWREAATPGGQWRYFTDRALTDYFGPAFAPAGLIEAQIVSLPKDWVSRSEAERMFRADWAKRESLAYRDPFPVLEDRKPEDEFAAAWTERRKTYLDTLAKPVLDGRNLRRANMASAFLPGVLLRNARLEGAVLSGARLEGADLSFARLEGADLSGARLEGADLSFARLEGADLSFARLEGADLRDARLEGADLTFARLEGAVLSGARLEGAVLSGARLEGADLRDARLEGAVLRDARLEGADLSFARLEGADLSFARLEGAVLRDARLEGAVLRDARLEGADLSDARLEGADLTEARLFGTHEKPLNLNIANLSAANFQASAFRFAILSEVSMTKLGNFASTFGDASVTLPVGAAPPCQWGRPEEGPLDDAQFFGRWRGWLKDQGAETIFIDFNGHDPIPPPAECRRRRFEKN